MHNLLHFHHHRIKEDHKSVKKSENTIILLLFKLQLFSPDLFLNVILSLSCNPPHTGIWKLIYSKVVFCWLASVTARRDYARKPCFPKYLCGETFSFKLSFIMFYRSVFNSHFSITPSIRMRGLCKEACGDVFSCLLLLFCFLFFFFQFS